ncbi:hypothetical protein QBC40DRAFT_91894 [Triangularia verruculosa]|uniref:Secreted protein n=1 Tax=Triangularia verruculosa TaxID=2587418 RepID=A0AAN6XPV0_9PEZI|nr:hypothetical protein QBC40DRAFT_91894 [Triangularia verruculosa]
MAFVFFWLIIFSFTFGTRRNHLNTGCDVAMIGVDSTANSHQSTSPASAMVARKTSNLKAVGSSPTSGAITFTNVSDSSFPFLFFNSSRECCKSFFNLLCMVHFVIPACPPASYLEGDTPADPDPDPPLLRLLALPRSPDTLNDEVFFFRGLFLRM